MPVQDRLRQDIVGGGVSVPVSALFAVSGLANAPYLVVVALDRDAYAAGATGATGWFSGVGISLALAPGGGNERVAGIVYRWTGSQYVNPVYGALSGLAYTSSASAGDVVNISVFTTANLTLATRDAMNPAGLMQADPLGYAGSSTLLTGGFAAAAAATPDRLEAVAARFVGQAWNDEGCWNLASTIAAESGAGLPLSATTLGLPGQGNGAWVVIYNGPSHAGLGWKSLVSAGDAVVFGTPGGGGHIALCVAGSGANAMLVDNLTLVDASGQISNAAHDGSANDVLILPPHPAVQEWAGVQADSVVIYALDTPVIAAAAPVDLAPGATVSLAALAGVSDPAGRAITQIQLFGTGTDSTLLVNGVAGVGSAADPLSARGLGAVSLLAGAVPGSDVVTIRAFNGLYWGDWQSVAVGIGPPAILEMGVVLAAGVGDLAGGGPAEASWHLPAWPVTGAAHAGAA